MAMNPEYAARREAFKRLLPFDVKTQNEWFNSIGINRPKEEYVKPILELIEFCIINVDKPADCTSHDVVQIIKKFFNASRAGHCGTLDPMVTGVLPILLNRACKLSNYFMKKDKEYVGKNSQIALIHNFSLVQEQKIFYALNQIKTTLPTEFISIIAVNSFFFASFSYKIAMFVLLR